MVPTLLAAKVCCFNALKIFVVLLCQLIYEVMDAKHLSNGVSIFYVQYIHISVTLYFARSFLLKHPV